MVVSGSCCIVRAGAKDAAFSPSVVEVVALAQRQPGRQQDARRLRGTAAGAGAAELADEEAAEAVEEGERDAGAEGEAQGLHRPHGTRTRAGTATRTRRRDLTRGGSATPPPSRRAPS